MIVNENWQKFCEVSTYNLRFLASTSTSVIPGKSILHNSTL